MSEVRNEISKMTIRGDLNMLYSMSKLIVAILDAAPDSTIACDTLCAVSEGMLEQAAHLYGTVSQYTEALRSK